MVTGWSGWTEILFDRTEPAEPEGVLEGQGLCDRLPAALLAPGKPLMCALDIEFNVAVRHSRPSTLDKVKMMRVGKCINCERVARRRLTL
jgi:hypothetical protein